MNESQRADMTAQVAQKVGFATADDLYNSIGYGETSVSKLLSKFNDIIKALKAEEAEAAEPKEPVVVTAPRPKHLRSNSGIIVDGADGCAVRFAKCCNPLPGDDVIGFITKGYGISIHKADCPNAKQGQNDPASADRWLKAWWETGESNDAAKDVYEALLQVHTLDEVGVLAEVASALSEMKVSILQINSQKAGNGRAILNLKVSCKNVEHYRSIVSRLKSLENVVDVVRGFS
jgi:GTP pyrophosphokinase